MFSFVIPNYNYDCTALVEALHTQAAALKQRLGTTFDYEIIVAEDGSNDPVALHANQRLDILPNCRHLVFTQNRGHARMRNYLVQQARFDYLIFIDSDALVCTDDFVARYWEYRNSADVVCGSLQNLSHCPRGGELRYRYEKKADRFRSLEYRRTHPYAFFSAFNTLFHRSVFDQLRFDERCTEYGYEDALLGLMLEKKGFRIAHIDNPLIHNGIDPSAIYLQKVEASLRTLKRLGEPMHSFSALVCTQRRLKRMHLLPLVRLAYRLFRLPLRWQLFSPYPSVFLLNCYKLGYYSELKD